MFNIFIKLFFIFFFFTTQSFSKNITIVDVNFLIQNSKAGKFIQKTLNDDNKKIIEELNKKGNELKNEEKKIVSQKNVLSEEEFRKKIDDYRKKINKHNLERKNKLEELNKKKATGIAKLLENLNKILVQYSTDNNIDLIIDKKYTILTKNEGDITNLILELLDKKITKINF